MSLPLPALLALENGRTFRGTAFGSIEKETFGEVVFNTSLTGYQEILTDPSYAGQIVTMTAPLIGNYGTNVNDVESAKPHVAGFIVRENARRASNWRSDLSLTHYLEKNNILGIEGLDTRALVRTLRSEGAMRGVIATGDMKPDDLVDRAKKSPSMIGADLVSGVTTKTPYDWLEGDIALDGKSRATISTNGSSKFVVVMDFGVKYNILRRLVAHGCRLRVVPAQTSAQEILAMNPDGIFLSNGPGDPEAVTYAIATVKELFGKRPMFGICLGHQLMALALGGKTYKLKFGHRGANHPVKRLESGIIDITSQNHGFSVDWSSMNEREVELTHVNLNDATVEGFRHRTLEAFSVQYHPEASPGPHESDYLFARFANMMSKEKVLQ